MTPRGKYCPLIMSSPFVVVIDKGKPGGEGMNMKTKEDQDIGHEASRFMNQRDQPQQGA